ncbi:DUF3310 domain-containing protein [Staphylococcus cohnii]|uniref:DUF3310 domain-containing protein n=1 Tax=Staphylococcus cohnii TaxID=29382 RepID=UPI003CEEFE8D
MKISDLKIGNYVVVNDLGAGKYSSGMRVIGRVVEIDDKGNYAIIESLPKHRYEITDFNDFELWTKEIADKTESMSKVKIKDLNLGDTIRIPHGIMYLEGKVVSISDVFATVHFPSVGHKAIDDESDFKRIRKARKSLDPNKWLEKAIEENKENSKSVLEAGLGVSKPTTDHKQSNDLQQRKRKEQNVKPDYYQFDDFEMYEIVEAICKHYNPVVAAWIGQAIQYIGRAPRKNGKEDIGKARDMIERAFEVWDVK